MVFLDRFGLRLDRLGEGMEIVPGTYKVSQELCCKTIRLSLAFWFWSIFSHNSESLLFLLIYHSSVSSDSSDLWRLHDCKLSTSTWSVTEFPRAIIAVTPFQRPDWIPRRLSTTSVVSSFPKCGSGFLGVLRYLPWCWNNWILNLADSKCQTCPLL